MTSTFQTFLLRKMINVLRVFSHIRRRHRETHTSCTVQCRQPTAASALARASRQTSFNMFRRHPLPAFISRVFLIGFRRKIYWVAPLKSAALAEAQRVETGGGPRWARRGVAAGGGGAFVVGAIGGAAVNAWVSALSFFGALWRREQAPHAAAANARRADEA